MKDTDTDTMEMKNDQLADLIRRVENRMIERWNDMDRKMMRWNAGPGRKLKVDKADKTTITAIDMKPPIKDATDDTEEKGDKSLTWKYQQISYLHTCILGHKI